METPASERRITRSQIAAAANNIPTSNKGEESEKKVFSRQRNLKNDRSALIDITNDSPIVGLARGKLESPSSFVNKNDRHKETPGSGEDLLRGQVKTLLQKVEEEADSPSGLQAQTPEGVIDIDKTKQEVQESERSVMIRSLLLDFSEKSDLTCQEEISKSPEKELEDDDASVWSIQVNASTKDEEEIEEVEEGGGDYDCYYEEEEEEEEEGEEEEGGEGLVDELCAGLSKMSVEEKRLPEFKGKHTRFLYNSDDEIEREEEVSESILAADSSSVSPNIVRLKGLPDPQGKHLRFTQEED